MRFGFRVAVLAFACVVGFVSAEEKAGSSSGFVPKDFEGWEGLIKEYWSVNKDGDLVGYTSKDPGFNTFLCSKKMYKDFEMSFEVRLKNGDGNSGIQIRSKLADKKKFAVHGPQADIGKDYWGSLYGEGFGGMMKAASSESQKAIKAKGFNAYSIKCVGKKVTIKINGVTTVDEEFAKMPAEGIIAFQLHAGYPSMEVTFKNLKFKDLSEK